MDIKSAVMPADVAPCRVLCVDDNHDVADLEAIMLQLCGFDSKACYDGATALAEARSYLPKVCLIDLNMPGMDGDEVAVRLKRFDELKPLHLVAITAQCCEEARERIENAGFHLHLVKPVDPRKLINEVQRLCREEVDHCCETTFVT